MTSLRSQWGFGEVSTYEALSEHWSLLFSSFVFVLLVGTADVMGFISTFFIRKRISMRRGSLEGIRSSPSERPVAVLLLTTPDPDFWDP
jgi:hypothetical protein